MKAMGWKRAVRLTLDGELVDGDVTKTDLVVNLRYAKQTRGVKPVTVVLRGTSALRYRYMMLEARLAQVTTDAAVMDEELRFLKLEAENMALSLEAAGFGGGGKLCTPLGRYRDRFPLPSLSARCLHCGTERGEHLAYTMACPSGRKTRIGTILFSKTSTFSPK